MITHPPVPRRHHLLALLCMTLTMASVPAPSAEEAVRQDWPRFRGPDLDGKSNETGLLDTWPEDGPTVVWRKTIGEGYSGISIADGRLFTMYDIGSSEFVMCLDATTGKEVWRFRSDEKYQDDMGSGPRATPAVDGDRVYALGAKGSLHALSADKGKVLWMADLAKTYGARIPRWGVSTEPLVHGDLLIVNVGGDEGRSVVAFDKLTGKQKWAAGDDGAGYASPLPITVAGVDQLLVFNDKALVALAPKDGAELWRRDWKTDWDVNAATPIFLPPNRVFVSSGYSTGSAVIEIKKDDDGKLSVTEVWATERFKNQFSSSIRVGSHLYGFDNRVLKAVDLTTGEDAWKQSGLGHGSLTYADGNLYVLGEKGRLVLVEAKPKAYNEKGTMQPFDGKCWTVPTVSGGKLYIRDEHELICLDIAQ